MTSKRELRDALRLAVERINSLRMKYHQLRVEVSGMVRQARAEGFAAGSEVVIPLHTTHLARATDLAREQGYLEGVAAGSRAVDEARDEGYTKGWNSRDELQCDHE